MSRAYENLKREVKIHGGRMSTAGLALISIGDLLGADTHDHGLSEEQCDGLAHAVQAIGYLAQESGNHLYFFDEEGGAK